MSSQSQAHAEEVARILEDFYRRKGIPTESDMRDLASALYSTSSAVKDWFWRRRELDQRSKQQTEARSSVHGSSLSGKVAREGEENLMIHGKTQRLAASILKVNGKTVVQAPLVAVGAGLLRWRSENAGDTCLDLGYSNAMLGWSVVDQGALFRAYFPFGDIKSIMLSQRDTNLFEIHISLHRPAELMREDWSLEKASWVKFRELGGKPLSDCVEHILIANSYIMAQIRPILQQIPALRSILTENLQTSK